MWDLWILLATRSFEEDAIIGKQLDYFLRDNRNCVECRHCVHDICAGVLKNLPPVSQSLGNNFCKEVGNAGSREISASRCECTR